MIDLNKVLFDNALNETTGLINTIDEAAKQLKSAAIKLKSAAAARNNFERRQNPYIVKSVIKYMARGMCQDDAIARTADEFKTRESRVSVLLWQQKRYLSAVNLYARRYLCEKLKKSGMSAAEISQILGVSTNHVYKLLKTNVDFWFLK